VHGLRKFFGMPFPDPAMGGRAMEDLVRDATVAYVTEFASGLAASALSPEEFQRSRHHLDEWWDRIASMNHGAAPGGNGDAGDPDPAAPSIAVDVDESGSRSAPAVPAPEPEPEPGPESESESESGDLNAPESPPRPGGRLEGDTTVAAMLLTPGRTAQNLRTAAEAVWDAAAEVGVVLAMHKAGWLESTDLWTATNLLLLRLPRDRAAELRADVSTAVGLDPDTSDRILVPGYEGSAVVDLDVHEGAVELARRRLDPATVGEAWTAHQPLLDALGNVLVLLELEAANLRIPHPRLGKVDGLLKTPARRPGQQRPGQGGKTVGDESADTYLSRVDLVLSKEANGEGLCDVLELTLAVVSNPVPHHKSWWAQNATAAITYTGRALSNHGMKVVALITTPGPGSSDHVLRVQKPEWASQKGTLLWTLMPDVTTGDGSVRPGRGIYAQN
jgi:hypothetical protein